MIQHFLKNWSDNTYKYVYNTVGIHNQAAQLKFQILAQEPFYTPFLVGWLKSKEVVVRPMCLLFIAISQQFSADTAPFCCLWLDSLEYNLYTYRLFT